MTFRILQRYLNSSVSRDGLVDVRTLLLTNTYDSLDDAIASSKRLASAPAAVEYIIVVDVAVVKSEASVKVKYLPEYDAIIESYPIEKRVATTPRRREWSRAKKGRTYRRIGAPDRRK